MRSIDNVVQRSNGAYTHDDVFALDVVLVKQLALMWYEDDMYQQRKNLEGRKLNSND